MTDSHPNFEGLCRWVEDDVPARRREEISDHLVGCIECQETVRTLRALGQSASRLSAPELPDDLWEGIVERRRRGDRVLLPTEPPQAGGGADGGSGTDSEGGSWGLGRWAAGLAATLLVAAAGIWLLDSRPAEAGRSELRFHPPDPGAGERISVEYEPGTLLAGADSLRLRARLRTPSDQWYNRGAMQSTAAVLEPGPDGLYRGEFALPPSVMYGSFVVEDPGGGRVDANRGRLWELLVSDSTGRPLYPALEQQIADLVGSNWARARRVSRRVTELYPDRPSAWHSYALFQRRANADRLPDSLKAFHRERFQRFQRQLRDRDDLSATRVSDMASYAMTVGDSEAWSYWQDRLEEEFPRHPSVLFRRASSGDGPDRPEADLERLEELWPVLLGSEAGSPRAKEAYQRIFIGNGLTASRRAEAPEAYRRWVRRYREHVRVTPGGVAHNARWMLDRPSLRPEGMEWIRGWVERLDPVPHAYRKLQNTRDEQRLEFRDAGQALLALLGKGLLAEGDTAAALDTLDLAMRRGWNPQAFRLLAEVRRSLGDTAGAVAAYARVAVDPGIPRSGQSETPGADPEEDDLPGWTAEAAEAGLPDSVRGWITSAADSARWERALAGARREMVRETMAAAEHVPLPGPVRLRSLSGESRTLRELSGGRVTLVAFWDRHSTYPPDLGLLDRLATHLAERGVRIVTIAESGPVSEIRRFLADHDLDLPVYLDHQGEAKDAFSQTAVTDYYLVDPSGRIAFGTNQLSLGEIPRSAEALVLDGGSYSTGDP